MGLLSPSSSLGSRGSAQGVYFAPLRTRRTRQWTHQQQNPVPTAPLTHFAAGRWLGRHHARGGSLPPLGGPCHLRQRRSARHHRYRKAGIQSTGGEPCQLRRYMLHIGYSAAHFQLWRLDLLGPRPKQQTAGPKTDEVLKRPAEINPKYEERLRREREAGAASCRGRTGSRTASCRGRTGSHTAQSRERTSRGLRQMDGGAQTTRS